MSEVELSFKWYLDWAFLKIGAWNTVQSGVTSGPFGGNYYELKPVVDPLYNNGQVWDGIRKDWCFETGVNYQTPTIPITSVIANTANSGDITTTQSHNLSVGDTIIISSNTIGDYNDTFTVNTVTSTTSVSVTGIANSGTGTSGSLVGQYNPVSVSLSVNGTGITTGTAGLTHHINYPLGRVIFDSPLNTGTDNVVAQYSYRNVQTYIADSTPWLTEIQWDTYRPDTLNWNSREVIDA